MTPSFTIGSRRVGGGSPCYVVAEISANHNQQFDLAVDTIRAAKQSGADAVKLQTYTPDTLTIDSDREWFKIPDGGLWSGKTLYELYGVAYTPWEWHAALQRVAHEEGIDWFSTPFDSSAVEFLEQLGVPAYKIASFELVDLPLLRCVGRTGKPVVLSTGMASLTEIELSVATLRESGARDLALLKCTSAYPARPADMNLRTMPSLATTFGAVVGLSDHTLGDAVSVAAVALGASIIEKHFTLARAGGGPDAAFSMEPSEFTAMVRSIRTVEQALGTVSFERTPEEERNLCFRRSLFVVADMKAGDMFTDRNVRPIRPGYGLPPVHLDQVLGRRATCNIERGTPLSWALVGGANA